MQNLEKYIQILAKHRKETNMTAEIYKTIFLQKAIFYTEQFSFFQPNSYEEWNNNYLYTLLSLTINCYEEYDLLLASVNDNTRMYYFIGKTPINDLLSILMIFIGKLAYQKEFKTRDFLALYDCIKEIIKANNLNFHKEFSKYLENNSFNEEFKTFIKTDLKDFNIALNIKTKEN